MYSYDNCQIQEEPDNEIMEWLTSLKMQLEPHVYLGSLEVLRESTIHTAEAAKELKANVRKIITCGLNKFFKITEELVGSEFEEKLTATTVKRVFAACKKRDYFFSKLDQFKAGKLLDLAPLVRLEPDELMEMAAKDLEGSMARIIEENRAAATFGFNLLDLKKEWEHAKNDIDYEITECIKIALNLVLAHRLDCTKIKE